MNGEGEPQSAGGPFDPRIEAAVASFLERHRRGERPSIEEYARQHPELAERIRRLFPALRFLEEIPQPAASATEFSPNLAAALDSSAPSALPQRLGEYRILRELGRGGMGVVYEAEQESLGRRVALKVLSSATWTSPKFRDRFRREARAAAALEHPHIVPIYGFGEDGGVSYYAMQRIHGAGLDEVLAELRGLCAVEESPAGRLADAGAASGSKGLSSSLALGLLSGRYDATPAQRGAAERGPPESVAPESGALESPLPECAQEASPRAGGTTQALSPAYFREVARLGREAASALAFAHERGVLHRDIKPANLLLDESGQVWVSDFGLARVEGLEELTQSGEVLGTLRYMAPEQFEGTPDARSDLYSLGLSLYELITLRPAFRGERGALVQKILSELPPRPREVEPRIPPELDAIVWRAIRKDPVERYPSARELALDIERFLGGVPISLPAPQSPRSCSWRRAAAASSDPWRNSAPGCDLPGGHCPVWGLAPREGDQGV